MATKRDRIVLLGNGPSKVECPDFGDTEIWTAVSVLGDKDFADRPYSMAFCFDNPKKKPDEAVGLAIAKEKGIPVMGLGSYCTDMYPIWDIIKAFNNNFFLNDLSYMIALAIYQGFERLFLYGVDQTGIDHIGGSYKKGRAYVAFWLGVATGRGIQYRIASSSEPWMRSSRIGGY